MSLALSFLGGMAQRGMQINDEKREVKNRLELETKLTNMRMKAQARKESAARNAARAKEKEEAIAMFKAFGGPNMDKGMLEYVTSLPTVAQNSLLEKAQGENAVDLSTLIKVQQVTGDDGTQSSDYSINMEQFNKQYRVKQDTLANEFQSLGIQYLDNPTEENKQKMIKVHNLISEFREPKDGRTMSVATLQSTHDFFLMQNGLATKRDGKIDLKKKEWDGIKPFTFIKGYQNAVNTQTKFFSTENEYDNVPEIQRHLEGVNSTLDNQINEVIQGVTAGNKDGVDKDTKAVKLVQVLNVEDYYQYNQMGVPDKKNLLQQIMNAAFKIDNKVIQVKQDDRTIYEMIGTGDHPIMTQDTLRRLGLLG